VKRCFAFGADNSFRARKSICNLSPTGDLHEGCRQSLHPCCAHSTAPQSKALRSCPIYPPTVWRGHQTDRLETCRRRRGKTEGWLLLDLLGCGTAEGSRRNPAAGAKTPVAIAPHLAEWRGARWIGTTPLLLKPARTENVAPDSLPSATRPATAIVPQGGNNRTRRETDFPRAVKCCCRWRRMDRHPRRILDRGQFHNRRRAGGRGSPMSRKAADEAGTPVFP